MMHFIETEPDKTKFSMCIFSEGTNLAVHNSNLDLNKYRKETRKIVIL